MGRCRIIWLELICLTLIGISSTQALDKIELEARLDDADRTVTGRMLVTFGPERPRKDLRFRLYPNAVADSSSPPLIVDSIFINGVDLTDRMVAEVSDLHIEVPSSLALAPTAEVRLYFRTVVPEQQNRFGYFDDQYALETWFPMPAPIRDGRWVRIDYAPTAEPVADFYDFEVEFTLPDSLLLIAPGLESVDTSDEKTAHLHLEGAHEMPLLVGRNFELKTARLGETRVDIYYNDRGTPFVDTTLKLTLQTMQFMSDSVLAYPYDELIVVIGGTPGGFGLEMPRMIWLPSRGWDMITVHEVVHQWFYGMLNSDQSAHPWLDEATTEYFTLRLLQKFRSEGARDMEFLGLSADYKAMLRVIGRKYFGLLPVNLPAVSYDWKSYQPTIYYKGTFLIQTMVGLMGQDRASQFWRDYAATHAMSRPTPEDFYTTADRYLADVGVTAAEIMGMVADLDYAILDIRSEEIVAAEADSMSVEQEMRDIRYRCEVDWSARYPLPSPVIIRMAFVDGSVLDTLLIPASGEHTLVLESRDRPIISAIIDPEGVYTIDVDYLNNSLLLYSHSAGVRVFSGLTYLLQLLTGVVWGW